MRLRSSREKQPDGSALTMQEVISEFIQPVHFNVIDCWAGQ